MQRKPQKKHKKKTKSRLTKDKIVRERVFSSPVFPSLETSFVEKVMKGFPVIENLITIMDDIRSSTHIPQQSQSNKRQCPL